MSSIWKYSTTADGLYSNDTTSVVGYHDGTVYASFDGAVSMRDRGTGKWSTIFSYNDELSGTSQNSDIYVNEQNGTLYASCNTINRANGGLYIRFRDNPKTVMITSEKDGIASNHVNAIAVNYSYSTQDPIGAVRLLHIEYLAFSKYHTEPGSLQGKWTYRLPAEWVGKGINVVWNMKIFNNVIYACFNNMLSYSKDDGDHWTNMTSFKINPTHEGDIPELDQPLSVEDIYVDELDHIYMVAGSVGGESGTSYSYLMRSTDQLKTWDLLLMNVNSPYHSITGNGDNLYLLSNLAVRVWNKKTGSVKVFDESNFQNILCNKMFVDPNPNGNLYVPTELSGVAYASLADVAASPAVWTYVGTAAGLSTDTITSLAGVDASSTGSKTAVYAGGNQGLAVTTNGGSSWSRIMQTTAGLTLYDKVFNGLEYMNVAGYPTVAAGTSRHGVFRITDYYGSSPTVAAIHYTTSDGLASNDVQCVCLQSDGTIIAGHLGQGLSIQPKLTAPTWRVVTKNDGLAGNYFYSVKASRNGGQRVYAAGYDKGVVQKGALSISTDSGKTWTAINKFMSADSSEYPYAEIYDVLEDTRWNAGKQYIYVCGYGGEADQRIYVMRSGDMGKTWELSPIPVIELPINWPINYIPKMSMTRDGTLYLALGDQIQWFLWDDNYVFSTSWEDGLLGKNSGALFIDRDGQIYAGTSGRGVAVSNVSYPLDFTG